MSRELSSYALKGVEDDDEEEEGEVREVRPKNGKGGVGAKEAKVKGLVPGETCSQ
jgi:hypothetical protein